MDLRLVDRMPRAVALAAVAIGLVLAACSALPFPVPTHPAQALLDACRKVLLPAVNAETFDMKAPNCVIVLWDMTMEGVVLTPSPPARPETRTLPVKLETAARAAGYQDSCGYETTDREGWLKHLPPVDVSLSDSAGWIATIWTRGATRQQADALCTLIESQ